MTKLNGYMDICDADYDELSLKPFIWGEKIKEFLSKDKKANLFYVKDEQLSEKTDKEYPFVLLTGRTRDQWHSGTKTDRQKSLLKYKELEFVEINIADADELGIKDGDKVKVKSKRGEIVAKAVVTKNISIKNLFVPISHRGVNYLTNDLLDKESLEPDYNNCAVRIVKI